MPEPTDKNSVMRFLGIIKYIGKFIPNLSQITFPLRELTRNDVLWSWTEEHSDCVKKLKRIIASRPVLAHYDERKPLIIQSDACKDGLGCPLVQSGRPIAFGSRALTKTEQKYAMIEKELLGVCFAMEHYHYFTYGRKVIVQTDHKPLISIVKRNMDKVPGRLQRMLLKMTKYDYELVFLPGSKMLLADDLSRATVGSVPAEDPELEFVIHKIISNVMSVERKNSFQDATKADPVLSQVLEFVEKGWPRKQTPATNPFYQIRERLCHEDNLLLLDDRIVVPSGLQRYVITSLHEGHLGSTKMKMKAKQLFYWPGMGNMIDRFAASCQVCQENMPRNSREPMTLAPLPPRAWSKLGMDILEFKSENWLVTVDYFSKWIEIIKLSSRSIAEIKQKCLVMFATHGYPDEIICDNVPFNSHEFRNFLLEKGVRLVTSSPHYPQGHAMAESAVKIVQNIFRKARMTGQNPYTLLFHYRNTPIPSLGFSPSQLLNNRSMKDKLNEREQVLLPKVPNQKQVEDGMRRAQEKQKSHYDRKAKQLPQIHEDEEVWFRHRNSWRKGRISHMADTPNSVWIKADDGGEFRRNRRDVRKVPVLDGMGNGDELNASQEESKSGYNLRSKELLRKPDPL
ncbi:Hypothetical Protein NTJ_04187 [Nesidiocoris tenuis]|uniref:RNA-directed DNA polymerase n=2 Tax=Nesidiocoris tenuis TaxID=355587 RepID=A0ABN7AKJ1_9HEMI|nr:Hypothetical Protein NTJ_04187 [Nesidiocoris tenuis]